MLASASPSSATFLSEIMSILRDVKLAAFFDELASFLFQTDLERFLFGHLLLCCKFPNVFCDFHAAEVRPAHAAKVCSLGAFLRKGLVVELARGLRIEREIELIFPAKFETRFADRVVAVLGAGMAFGEIGGVRGDLVGDDAVLHVLLIRQTEMFFRRDVAKHGASVPADPSRADGAG